MGFFTDELTVKAYKFAYSQNYDHSYPNENIIRLSSALKIKKDSKCLDYGYGFGENLIHFAKKGLDMYGIDIDNDLKRKVFKKISDRNLRLKYSPKLQTLKSSDKKLPYKKNFFDFILCNQTLYLLADEIKIQKLLKDIYRITKKNGTLLFTMMSEKNWCCTDGEYLGNNVYSFDDKSKLNKIKGNFLHKYYIVNSIPHIKYLFKDFIVEEVGFFDNSYYGVNGHHYVVICKKK